MNHKLTSYFPLLLFFLLPRLSLSQNFTPIDTLPEGAYGAAAWGDYDGDGFKDLAYLTQAIPNTICYIYHNTGNVFTQVAQYFPPLFSPAVRWADLDNDGFEDLVMNGLDTTFHNRTFIYKSNGDGTFTSEPNSIFPLSAGSIDVADYNNDGWMDIAVTGFDSVGVEHAYIYKNLGGFNFSNINATLFGIHFGELKWGDYNDDGLPDLVINGIGAANIFKTRIYKNMGADNFQLQNIDMKGSSGTVDWIDYDNDGWLDILVTGYDSTFGNNFTELHHNNADGTFSADPGNLPDFGEPSGVAVADFNIDGNQDICFIGGCDISTYDFSALAMGQGSSNFTVTPFFPGSFDNPIVETTDMDNDGDYDLIFNNIILRNDFTATSVFDPPAIGDDITLYPNPANDKVFLKSSDEVNSIQVCDLTGRPVSSSQFLSKPYMVQLTNLENGIYFINVTLANGKNSFKKLNVLH